MITKKVSEIKMRKPNRNLKKKALPWLLVSPALILSIFVVGAPTIGTLAISLTNWDGFNKSGFIGIQNYKDLLHDSNFYMALANNFKWMIYFMTIPIIFALIIAVSVSKVKKGQMFLRSGFFIPNVVSIIVTAKIWSLIYNPFFGINSLLEKLGIHNLPMYLGNTSIALFSVAFVDSWRYWGFLMVLFLTALQQTDKSLEEAAMIDGCTEMQVFWKIMFPLAKPAFLTVDLLVVLWTWNEFFFANAFIQSDNLKTVSTRYLMFTGQFSSDWTKISATGLIAIVPILAIYFFFQRNFIEGLTAGSIKG